MVNHPQNLNLLIIQVGSLSVKMSELVNSLIVI